jgi:hypothetical protein
MEASQAARKHVGLLETYQIARLKVSLNKCISGCMDAYKDTEVKQAVS